MTIMLDASRKLFLMLGILQLFQLGYFDSEENFPTCTWSHNKDCGIISSPNLLHDSDKCEIKYRSSLNMAQHYKFFDINIKGKDRQSEEIVYVCSKPVQTLSSTFVSITLNRRPLFYSGCKKIKDIGSVHDNYQKMIVLRIEIEVLNNVEVSLLVDDPVAGKGCRGTSANLYLAVVSVAAVGGLAILLTIIACCTHRLSKAPKQPHQVANEQVHEVHVPVEPIINDGLYSDVDLYPMENVPVSTLPSSSNRSSPDGTTSGEPDSNTIGSNIDPSDTAIYATPNKKKKTSTRTLENDLYEKAVRGQI